ncbi:hypothetical protein [Streptomyces sp. DH24]|uniref:hypothetical protein n=1 Tax=Streptomyces sp. DH24 TaxID=3040123 RepID=UPI0024412A97|nr:hypothetical protein [Streptomyces sp. DH24]MDG9720435.1 hypothetical protein [Streptomyces sp. DH24]
MPTSRTARPAPPTVWPARGRHTGTDAADVVLGTLKRHKDGQVLDDFLELPGAEAPGEDGADGTGGHRVFEARWRVDGTVTVRARLELAPASGGGQDWLLIAEAEQHWDQAWPSPATMFWPDAPDTAWDHDATTGLRLRDINPLPDDDKDARRLLRDAGRSAWGVHVVVHEAHTTDERGRVPLARHLPPGLRHRVVEHRAAPQQLRVVNWALRALDVEVPRGGAVVLPGDPPPAGYDDRDFSVRAVFLDGSEPAELVAAVTAYAALDRPLPEDADRALTALREQWRLLTLEEELARERRLVAMYAEALEAMTKSRDLYREAAEAANEALAALREADGAGGGPKPVSLPAPASPLQQLTRTLDRFRVRGPRSAPAAETGREDDGR